MGKINENFDFSSFSSKIINKVDSIRSKNKDTGVLEPRINAFYRALGLPAVTPSSTGAENYPKANNGNLVETNAFPPDKKLKLDQRRIAGGQKVTETELEGFLDSNNQSIIESLADRKRGAIKPMVVDNRIIITPVSKRFTDPFASDSDSELMDTKLNRPLIESIISIRMKIENIQNTQTQNRIQIAIAAEMREFGEDIIYLFKSSLNNVGKVVENVVNEVGKVRRHIGEVVNAQPGNIPLENPSTRKGSGSGETEEAASKQLAELAIRESRVATFNFDDTFGGQEASSQVRNLKEGFLVSDILEAIVTSPSYGIINKSISENQSKTKKVRAILKRAYRDLDLVLGTFSGLSGTDVLVIVTALFTIDINDLVSLLNDKAKTNLAKHLGIDDLTASFPNMISTMGAVTKLEEKVEEHLNTIDNNIRQVKIDDKVENQADEE